MGAKGVQQTVVPPAADDLVWFTVLCRPKSGIDLDTLRARLSLETLADCLPEKETLDSVKQKLQQRGFTLFTTAKSPDVPASGTVAQFETAFGVKLVKRTRLVNTEAKYIQEWVDLADNSPKPSFEWLTGALHLTVTQPPTFNSSVSTNRRTALRLPDDIARLTGSAATHTISPPYGQPTKGFGVSVAVIDGGFFRHPYFDAHGYDIERLAAPGASDPANDESSHGTPVLASLLACAPAIHAIGVKVGTSTEIAFDHAVSQPNVRVISMSWGFNLVNDPVLPDGLISFALRILTAIDAGIAIVNSAGNGEMNFPAMMPEVIAVGGADLDDDSNFIVYHRTSSFVSPIYPQRNVPDFCAIAARMKLPVPPANAGGRARYASREGTSYAAPQVAGICALLIQKNPSLTPRDLQIALAQTADDIKAGTSAPLGKMPGQPARPGRDLATGDGLVNAFAAWQRV